MCIAVINDMYFSFPNMVEQIHTHLERRCQVIVHYSAGQQRSAAVIVVYLMSKHNYSLADTIKYIRFKKRDAVFFNVNFQDSLGMYEKVLHKTQNNTDFTTAYSLMDYFAQSFSDPLIKTQIYSNLCHSIFHN